MAKSSNQKLKSLYLLRFLMDNTDEEHYVTMPEIISYLDSNGINAERKSIYADIESLQLMGYDINYEKGRGYHVCSRDFELAELKLLVDAVQSSRFITEKKSEALIKKIEKLTSTYEGRKLQRQVYVVNRVKAGNEAVLYNIDHIHEAIASGVKLKFIYTGWNLKKELVPKNGGEPYVTEPKCLIWEDDNYYLVAYDCSAGKDKHFRVDKMISAEVTDEKAEHDSDTKFDVAVYVREHFGMFSGEQRVVTVIFPNSLIGVVIDRFGKDVTIIKRDDEHFAARLDVQVSGQFFGWLAGLGSRVSIEGPDDIKQEYRDYISEILKSLR